MTTAIALHRYSNTSAKRRAFCIAVVCIEVVNPLSAVSMPVLDLGRLTINIQCYAITIDRRPHGYLKNDSVQGAE